MTIPPNDPFARPPGPVSPSGMHNPTPLPPMPNAYPPPFGSRPRPGWAVSKPSGLALWAIITTGLYTLIALLSALTIQSTLADMRSMLAEGSTTAPLDPLEALSFFVAVASYVLLATWMMTIRKNLAKRGIVAGGPPAVEWWGWFIPVASYVLPFLGMKAIARRTVSMGMLLGWWIPFCCVWVANAIATVSILVAFDFTTGEVVNLSALDAAVGFTYASAFALLMSWGFLVAIIRGVTERHLTTT